MAGGCVGEGRAGRSAGGLRGSALRGGAEGSLGGRGRSGGRGIAREAMTRRLVLVRIGAVGGPAGGGGGWRGGAWGRVVRDEAQGICAGVPSAVGLRGVWAVAVAVGGAGSRGRS